MRSAERNQPDCRPWDESEVKAFIQAITNDRLYPKTQNGKRVLPLPKPVQAAPVSFRALQKGEALTAGAAYEASGYVVVDELGRPFKTDKLRREAHRLMERAGVRRVRLYDARHAVLSWMANNGVPDTVVSAWAGHSDLSFTKRVYVHPIRRVFGLVRTSWASCSPVEGDPLGL
ncbi:tyrosine-type recombinase/integrase [Streptomyces sp. BP-8]|uniref:Tyrosine-type recombinase/integrase n=1 Tax=Streptomyces sirii TaxID=3127701 RepID=A0ABZ2QLY9_9ACTN